jgi:hypothetical protein
MLKVTVQTNCSFLCMCTLPHRPSVHECVPTLLSCSNYINVVIDVVLCGRCGALVACFDVAIPLLVLLFSL